MSSAWNAMGADARAKRPRRVNDRDGDFCL
jgi:hypothetical protein